MSRVHFKIKYCIINLILKIYQPLAERKQKIMKNKYKSSLNKLLTVFF